MTTGQLALLVIGELIFFGMLMFFSMLDEATDAGTARMCIEQGMQWVDEECKR